MKRLIREHIKQHIRDLLEDRKYNLQALSPVAYNSLSGYSGSNLNIPPSAIKDVKIVKAPRPIFRCFFENGHYFDLIDSHGNMEANINNLLFDLSDDRDLNAAQKEVERLMQKGKITSDDEQASDDFEEPSEEEPAEPEA